MIAFDTSDPAEPSWKNISNDNIPYFWGGRAQYVRYGSKGIVVSVGGKTLETISGQVPIRTMNNICVYDIAAEKWFPITATGDIPSARSKFCSALTATPDDSSFHMIIHGGWEEESYTTQEHVYILVMPAFHWIKINTTINENSSPNV